MPAATVPPPPAVLALLAHPVRWGLLDALAASDRPVRELTTIVDEPQSLVSYHLRKLRDAGLVRAHRSSADRRDTYYAIDLAQCRSQLLGAGGTLHPGLRPEPPPSSSPHASDHSRAVLFLCTGNSARSQMAEALLRHESGGMVDTASAGSAPKPLHPNAVRVMRSRGIDISHQRAKHIDELADRHFDVVVTLCDRVREVCPELLDQPRRVHWSISDPAREGETDEDSLPAFRRTATELSTRIEFLLVQLDDLITREEHHVR